MKARGGGGDAHSGLIIGNGEAAHVSVRNVVTRYSPFAA